MEGTYALEHLNLAGSSGIVDGANQMPVGELIGGANVNEGGLDTLTKVNVKLVSSDAGKSLEEPRKKDKKFGQHLIRSIRL